MPQRGGLVLTVVPDYYKDFKCIADRCKHNCCIGWEIDIDSDTLSLYRGVSGELGARLEKNIALEDEPHFVLAQDDRCPFLNDKNLCDIICSLGDGALCSICRDHPRFRNELPDRVEIGLGLCCEEAARIVLTRREKTVLSFMGGDDDIILLRDRIFAVLQNREKSIDERLCDMFALFGTGVPSFDIKSWCERLEQFERLDDAWGEMLTLTKAKSVGAENAEFDRFMSGRETEYEQFLVYIIFRHFAVAPDTDEAYRRTCFAAFAYHLLRAMGAALFKARGEFTVEDQIDIARMFSAEIEYSDENLYAIIDEF